jgi:hypothetical protein
MCHSSKNSSSLQSSTKSQKGFVTYNPKHGITSMQKHVANEHNSNLQKFLLHKNFYVEGRDGGKRHKCIKKHLPHLQPSLNVLEV